MSSVTSVVINISFPRAPSYAKYVERTGRLVAKDGDSRVPQVTIYTSTGCVYCTRLKGWLQEREIGFAEKNVTENPAYMDELAKLGIYTSPVAMIGETPVVGFRPNKMSELLGLARA